jgi:predicted amidophosphoribosyltransferase
LVLALKLRARRPAAVPLAESIARVVQTTGSDATTITWVPGRPADIRRRGFDHAELIARELASSVGVPAVPMLTRTGHRPDQTTLSADARRQNLTGAFKGLRVAEKVMLVDDLVTTGTTAGVCGRALRDCGATYVEVVAPCRA